MADRNWAELARLLNEQPDLLADHPGETLRLQESQLDELLRHLQPGVQLPSLRLVHVPLTGPAVLHRLLTQHGVQTLHLRSCPLDAAAWQGLVDGALENREHDRPGLKSFGFCAAPAGSGQTPPDITDGLMGLLRNSPGLTTLSLGRVQLATAPVFDAMRGQVQRLTLDHMNAACFLPTEGHRACSPDVPHLRLRYWTRRSPSTADYPGCQEAIDALVRDGSSPLTLELTGMDRDIATCASVGRATHRRRHPVTARLDAAERPGPIPLKPPHLSGSLAFLTSSCNQNGKTACTAIECVSLSPHRELNPLEVRLLKQLPRLRALHMPNERWALDLPGEIGPHMRDEMMRQWVSEMPSLEVLTLTPRPSQPSTEPGAPVNPSDLATQRDRTWAPVLNRLVQSRARRHFVNRLSFANLPQDLNPSLLDDPVGGPARQGDRSVPSMTRVCREHYRVWVQSVQTAIDELPTGSTRWVPRLTLLPADPPSTTPSHTPGE